MAWWPSITRAPSRSYGLHRARTRGAPRKEAVRTGQTLIIRRGHGPDPVEDLDDAPVPRGDRRFHRGQRRLDAHRFAPLSPPAPALSLLSSLSPSWGPRMQNSTPSERNGPRGEAREVGARGGE